MKATSHQATSPVDAALSRTQPLNPEGSGIAPASSNQTPSRAWPSPIEMVSNWLRPAPDLDRVFDQIDPGCQHKLRHNRKQAVALKHLGERIRANPHISSVRLEHVVDPESGWEQIFVEANSVLSLNEAAKLEDEVVNSVSKAHWALFNNVGIVIRAQPDD